MHRSVESFLSEEKKKRENIIGATITYEGRLHPELLLHVGLQSYSERKVDGKRTVHFDSRDDGKNR